MSASILVAFMNAEEEVAGSSLVAGIGVFFLHPQFFISVAPQVATLIKTGLQYRSTHSLFRFDYMDSTNTQSTARVAAQGGPARRNAQNRIRRFCFTLNNWTDAEYAELTEDFALQTKWLIVGKEVGEGGTSHLQGACILGAQWAFSRLKAVPCLRRAHIEIMRGEPEDSLAYCSKEDAAPFVHGTMPVPGKRNDLRLATDRILAGASVKDLAMDAEAATVVVKFHKGLTVLRSLVTPKRQEKPVIVWLWGPTGVHKTRCALKSGRAMARALGRGVDDVWMSSGGLRWFDGYDGQSVVVLDDIRAKQCTSFAFFLRLLDRYPMSVEFKGGFVNWVPRVIFITCPYSPDLCFATRATHVPEDIAQLHRRIDRVIEFDAIKTAAERREFVAELLPLLPGAPAELEPQGEEVEDEDMLDPDFLN